MRACADSTANHEEHESELQSPVAAEDIRNGGEGRQEDRRREKIDRPNVTAQRSDLGASAVRLVRTFGDRVD